MALIYLGNETSAVGYSAFFCGPDFQSELQYPVENVVRVWLYLRRLANKRKRRSAHVCQLKYV